LYRIAISGANGVGKTTLGKLLAEHLNADFIEEDYSKIVKSLYTINKATTSEERLNLVKNFSEEINSWINRRNLIEDSKINFVSDRSVLDVFATILVSKVQIKNNNFIEFYKNICIKQMQKYDLLVLLPLSEFSMQASVNEIGLIRQSHLGLKIHEHAMTLGLASMFSPKNSFIIDDENSSVDTRVSMILDFLKNIKS